MKITPLLSLLLLLLLGMGQAQGAASPAEPRPDVRVIIDISGSMKQNDPNNLRRPALELLVKLFPEGAKAGVWTFGQWVNNLVPSAVVTPQWREQAFAKAASINSVALRTNIPDALRKAVNDSSTLDPAYKVHLILLTDGMVDVSPNADLNRQARQRILEQILPSIRDAGITIHTVGLSNNADQELMEILASETHGLSAVAETAEDLAAIFLQAFDAAVPAEQLPLEGNDFTVDASIDEFTALVFRQPGSEAASLTAPDGKVFSAVRHPDQINWFSQQNYDLITASKPLPGVWRINAQLQPDSRVTIVSNLDLKVNRLANSHFTGSQHPLQAVLSEEDVRITRPEFLNLVDMSVQLVRRDDGKQWHQSLSEPNPIPDDGVFATTLSMFEQAGVYDLVVEATARTFQRQYKQTFAVRERYDIRLATRAGSNPGHKISLYARDAAIDGASSQVLGRLIAPDGSSQAREVVPVGNRRWAVELEDLTQAGVYQLSFDVTGQLNSGASFTEQTPGIAIEHRLAGVEFIPPVVEPVPEPVPEPETEPAPIPEPVLEAVPEVAKDKVSEVEPTDSGVDYARLALYGGIVLGNLLIFGLAFFAYKLVMGGGDKTAALEAEPVETNYAPEPVEEAKQPEAEEAVAEDAADEVSSEVELDEVGVDKVDLDAMVDTVNSQATAEEQLDPKDVSLEDKVGDETQTDEVDLDQDFDLELSDSTDDDNPQEVKKS